MNESSFLGVRFTTKRAGTEDETAKVSRLGTFVAPFGRSLTNALLCLIDLATCYLLHATRGNQVELFALVQSIITCESGGDWGVIRSISRWPNVAESKVGR